MKKNKNGFVLVETLVVSVFVTLIFLIIYTNVLPIMATYKIRGNYDDIDSKYVAHYARKVIVNDANFTDIVSGASLGKQINCTMFDSSSDCQDIVNSLNIKKMYLIPFINTSMKNNTGSLPSNMDDVKEYISYMKAYTTNPYVGKTTYRLIILREDENEKQYFGNIEVVK